MNVFWADPNKGKGVLAWGGAVLRVEGGAKCDSCLVVDSRSAYSIKGLWIVPSPV